jgi:hypothetical protein
MDRPESETPDAPENTAANEEPSPASRDDAAQRAADGLKGQIAALRKQVKDAQEKLRGERPKEPRTFKR